MAYSSPIPMPFGNQAPQIPRPGMGQGNFLSNNPNMLLAIGAQLLAHRQNAQNPMIAPATLSEGMKADRETRQRNMTIDWLVKNKGLAPEDAQAAVSNPTILSELLGSKAPIKVGAGDTLLDPTTFQPIYQGQAGGTPTDDMRELAQINRELEAQGKPPVSMLDYQTGMRRAGSGGERLPTGWRYKDPTNPSAGIEPMAGGPGEQVPAEVGARIAAAQVAESAMADVDSILTEQTLTPEGIARWATNSGEYGRAQRAVTLAVESALRAMTGAAAPDSEVARYNNIFMPTPLDSPETINQKLSLLRQFITGAREMATRGRGGPSEIGGTDEEGWTDLGDGVRIRELP